MTDNDSCENCRFWKRDAPHQIGACRRRAPLPSFENGGVGMFATMASFDWCGEHEPEAATPEQIKEVRAVTMEYLKEAQHATKLFRLQEIT